MPNLKTLLELELFLMKVIRAELTKPFQYASDACPVLSGRVTKFLSHIFVQPNLTVRALSDLLIACRHTVYQLTVKLWLNSPLATVNQYYLLGVCPT